MDSFSGHQFSWFHLIDITPNPGLAGFDGTDERMLCFVEVLGGVLVLGRIAAADMPADEAQAKMDPGISHLHAFLTDMSRGVAKLDLIEVGAFFLHNSPSFGSASLPSVEIGPAKRNQTFVK
jgi:hypothetical protein